MRGIFWFRSDLRLRDNRGLAALAARADELLPVFVLDPGLLGSERTGAPRVRLLLDCLRRLAATLEERGSRLLVHRGDPEREIPRLARELRADRVVWNRDYSPFARARDTRIRHALGRLGVDVVTCKDRVVYESAEIQSTSGRPYAVYSPYRKSWRRRWDREPQLPERAPRLPQAIAGAKGDAIPAAEALGFLVGDVEIPTGGEDAARRRLDAFLDRGLAHYAERRDLPGVDGTSRLSPYLRFGVVSVRECVAAALARGREERSARRGADTWVDELVWRDFYAAILAENPRVVRESYRRELADLRWEDDEDGFRAWCEGRTGYPIIDAAMRQLATTGWMHNRARMIVASFLTKDLLVDWRRGEAFFYRALVDGDPASNNGGWQWSASTGTDAQPWFRIFNPVSQGQRFDPDGSYVRRYLPALEGVPDSHVHRPWELPEGERPRGYPAPIVDHAARRQLAVERFREASARGAAGASKGAGRGRG